LENRTANATARKAGNAVHEANLLLLDGFAPFVVFGAAVGALDDTVGFDAVGDDGAGDDGFGDDGAGGDGFGDDGAGGDGFGDDGAGDDGAGVDGFGDDGAGDDGAGDDGVSAPRATTARTKTTSAILFHIFINFLSTRNSTN